MNPHRVLTLITLWFLAFGLVAALVAVTSPAESGAGDGGRLGTLLVAGGIGLMSVLTAWGLWRRTAWARWLAVAVSLALAGAQLTVLPALVAVDVLVVWLLWRPGVSRAFDEKDARPAPD